MREARVPAEVNPNCYEFVAVVEELLERRQQELLHGQKDQPAWQLDEWGPRKWHRTELENTVYGSYKRMRQGFISHPPRREVVMEIANYLNCTVQERNRLLVAAYTYPIEPFFTGNELRRLVEIAAGVARSFELPLMILNRDWRIHYISETILRLYNVSVEQLSTIPLARLGMLNLLFDPQLPLYPNVIPQYASWEKMVRQTVYSFKMANRFCTFESWYKQTVNQLLQLPAFPRIWQEVSLDRPQLNFNQPLEGITFETILPGLRDTSQLACLRPITISVGYYQFDFPQIYALAPGNEITRRLFEELGLPVTPQNSPGANGYFVP
jgi:hypothetical protein